MSSIYVTFNVSTTSLNSAVSIFFFFNDTATTEIYTLSLHDALPILAREHRRRRGLPDDRVPHDRRRGGQVSPDGGEIDRKSTRLNSSHGYISYAVFCLKKKKRRLRSQFRTSVMYPIDYTARTPRAED